MNDICMQAKRKNMGFKILLDANILLDFLLKREFFNGSQKILSLVVRGKLQAFITPSIVHIIDYWLTKAYGNAKAKELLLTLLADVTVIDINHEITVNALHSKIADIEDALQYYTALHHKLDIFISRDKQLQKSGIPILPVASPERFLEEILPNSYDGE